MSEVEQTRFEEWAIVEVMGHNRYIGYVSERVIGGAAMVRVDVPQCGDVPAFTKYVGTGSIYAITPVSEEFALAAALRERAKPHNIYVPELYPQEVQRAIPSYHGDEDHETQYMHDRDNEQDDTDEDDLDL